MFALLINFICKLYEIQYSFTIFIIFAGINVCIRRLHITFQNIRLYFSYHSKCTFTTGNDDDDDVAHIS